MKIYTKIKLKLKKMITKYDFFLLKLNENVEQAKVYLKKKALSLKRTEAADRAKHVLSDEELKQITLTPEEVKKVETDPSFLAIKNLVKNDPGYTFLFTKMYNEDFKDTDTPETRLAALKELYDRIKSFGETINMLPQPVIMYAKKPEGSTQTYMDILSDALSELDTTLLVNRFMKRIDKKDRHLLNNLTPENKERLSFIAFEFSKLKNSSGIRANYGEKFTTINELLDNAEYYINSMRKPEFEEFYNDVISINNTYKTDGINIVFDKNLAIVAWVGCYDANKEFNYPKAPKLCISYSRSMWDSYVGDENKQYYIYDLNISGTERMSLVAVTVEADGSIYGDGGCQDKFNKHIGKQALAEHLTKLGTSIDILTPFTPKEIFEKNKRKNASRTLGTTHNLTIEMAKELIEELAADPNYNNGAPLKNAIAAHNLPVVAYLLSKGASASIDNNRLIIDALKANDKDILSLLFKHTTVPIQVGQSLLDSISSMETVKVLVDNGLEFTGSNLEVLYKKIYNKVSKKDASYDNFYDDLKYLIGLGMDPQLSDGLPLRHAVTLNDKKSIDFLLEKGSKISNRGYRILEHCITRNNIELLKYFIDILRKDNDPLLKGKKFVEERISYTGSDKLIKTVTIDPVSVINEFIVNTEEQMETDDLDEASGKEIISILRNILPKSAKIK